MAMVASDIVFFLSTTSASAGFSLSSTPGNSLGKYMSTTSVNPVTPLDDVFLDISSAQNAALQVDYQCLFVMNNTATGLTARGPYIWFPTALWTPGGANVGVGLDPTGRMPYNTSTVQALTINNTFQAPVGVSFTQGPQNVYTSGILLPSLPPLYCVAVWLQRSALGTPPLTPQSLGLTVTFQSDA